MRTWVEGKLLTIQFTSKKNLFDRVCMDFTIYRTDSQQRVTADAKESEKLMADKSAIDPELRNSQKKMEANTDLIQAILDDEVRRANEFVSKRVKLLVSRRVLSGNCS